MDGYPAASLDHNVPFIVASGLNAESPELALDESLREQGLLLKSDLPALESKEAELIDGYLQEIDARGKCWTIFKRDELYRLRIKTVGRSFLLPPRKARLPETYEPIDATPVLHSPFSPLSDVSALYPDGLIDSQWIRKHQELVPSIYLCFYSLHSDNQLKVEINDTKAALARSGFKTKVAVVLLGNVEAGTTELTESVQERLETIRKGTALDPKSIFYIPAQGSRIGVKRALDGILGVLYGTAVEYYRDLGRHARKKRSRGIAPPPTVPPTSGTSHTLSLPDWNFRYDFKTGILAEFRQEFDSSIRSMEQAYEILLGQDVLETIPNWSARWHEARQLSDIISIRCVRLHLWMGHPSLAARRWQTHRNRISDFVDRRGHGTNTYGWQAWEARWATVMANIIERVEVPGLVPASMTVFLPPEKSLMADRLQPWEYLHHTGYWYRIASRHLAARRTLAQMMSDDDRQPLGSANGKHSAGNHDSYMCPPPYLEYPLSGEGGVNHGQLIIDCLVTARTQFQARKQLRVAAELSLECAKEMAAAGSWDEVVAVLRPIWDDNSFRSDNWVDIADDMCWLMRRAAKETGRAELVVAADWELMNKKYSRRLHWRYDLSQSLEGLSVQSKPSVDLSQEAASPLISAGFVFRTKESKAGESCKAQLTLTSNAVAESSPITLTSVRIDFEGSLRSILIEHDSALKAETTTRMTEVALEEELAPGSSDDLPVRIRGRSNLALKAGQARTLEMTIPLREAGEAHASSVTLACSNDVFKLNYVIRFTEADPATGWTINGASRPRQLRAEGRTLNVQPRPPKMQITLLDASTQFYTDEVVELRVRLLNEEEEAATVKLDAHLSGKTVSAARVSLQGKEYNGEHEEEEMRVSGVAVGSITSGASAEMTLFIDPISSTTTYELLLRTTYHLESDTATPIIQTLPVQISIVGPFEANYDLLPRLHPDPWPSLFDSDNLADGAEDGAEDGDESAVARGFAQQWCLLCHYASFAAEDLVVTGVEMQVLSCAGGAQYKIVGAPETPESGMEVAPKTMHEAQFGLEVKKLSLDDRHTVSLDLAFIVKWKRGAGTSPRINVTTLPVGQYLVLGAEPRVLATVLHSPPTSSPNLMHLDLTVENPSGHFLTFGLTMEPSELFAFSGAKQSTIHLLPMSRRTVRYRLLPLVRGDYIRPGLVVRDKYFQKVLRIIPTEGMKIDKDGLLVWVPGDEDSDAS